LKQLALVLLLICPVNYAAILCRVSAQPFVFHSYNTISRTATTGRGKVSVRCNAGMSMSKDSTISYSVAISTGHSGSYHQRKMFNGHDSLIYNLYTNPSHTRIWGDDTRGTHKVFAVSRINNSKTIRVYGRISPHQDVEVGTYIDTITVTLEF